MKITKFPELALRLALAASFLSAVADRFGIWGKHGAANVAWGDWQHFLAYTARLNWFAPPWSIPLLGWAATTLEVVLAAFLLLGLRLRATAYASSALLLAFALVMGISGSFKAPLDYSVFTASAAAFFLGVVSDERKKSRTITEKGVKL